MQVAVEDVGAPVPVVPAPGTSHRITGSVRRYPAGHGKTAAVQVLSRYLVGDQQHFARISQLFEGNRIGADLQFPCGSEVADQAPVDAVVEGIDTMYR